MEGFALIPCSPTLALISHECIYCYWFSRERDWPLPIPILKQLLGSCTMDRILTIHCLSLSLSLSLDSLYYSQLERIIYKVICKAMFHYSDADAYIRMLITDSLE